MPAVCVVLLGASLPAGAAPDAAAARQCKAVRLTVGARPLGYRARGQVCDGEREGKWRFFFLDGRPLREGSYARGLESGRWRMWYHRRGRRQAEGDYRQGRRVGRWTRWHKNGKRSLEGTYGDGLRHGRWRRWHRNGALYEDRWYVEGKRAGMHWRWDRKGRGTLVRSCKADVCEVLCRGWGRKKRCAASDHPAVEDAMPQPSTTQKKTAPATRPAAARGAP